MDQSHIVIDPVVCHSTLKSSETVCGLAYFRDPQDQVQFVQESLKYYRLMVFFKNYPYEGPADLTFVYLWIVTSHCLRTVEKEVSEDAAKKKLMEIARESIPRPGDSKNFLGSFVKEPRDLTESSLFQSYLRGLKEILVSELLKILFFEGQRSNDFKFWIGTSKRKFMGLSYTGI